MAQYETTCPECHCHSLYHDSQSQRKRTSKLKTLNPCQGSPPPLSQSPSAPMLPPSQNWFIDSVPIRLRFDIKTIYFFCGIFFCRSRSTIAKNVESDAVSKQRFPPSLSLDQHQRRLAVVFTSKDNFLTGLNTTRSCCQGGLGLAERRKGRAGQGRAGQGRAAQCRAGQRRAARAGRVEVTW